MSEIYYQPSGKFGILGLPLSLILGGISAVLGGFAYSYATFYIPFIYINFFITLGFGFLVGMATMTGLKLGKVRNARISVILGIGIGLFANYAGWAAYIHAASNQEILTFDPFHIWAIALNIAEKGSWGIAGIQAIGAGLWTVWAIEFSIILILTILLCVSSASDPFCETCNQWANAETGLGPFDTIKDREQLISELENQNYDQLGKLGAPSEQSKFTNFNLSHCPQCKQFAVLSINEVSLSQNNKGEIDTEKDEVIGGLLISSLTYQKLEQFSAAAHAEESAEIDKDEHLKKQEVSSE